MPVDPDYDEIDRLIDLDPIALGQRCRRAERELEHLRVRLAEAEGIITMALYSGSYEGDMLERMWKAAEEWLAIGLREAAR